MRQFGDFHFILKGSGAHSRTFDICEDLFCNYFCLYIYQLYWIHSTTLDFLTDLDVKCQIL